MRCPACNAGLPVDGRTAVVTCLYCDARVEVDGHAARHPGSPPAVPRRSGALWSWLVFLIVLTVSGGMAAFQFLRAQAIATTTASPTPVTTATPTAQHVTTSRDIVSAPRNAPPAPTPELEAPAADPPSAAEHEAAPKPKRAAKPPAPAGPTITVDEARKLIEPKARACMQQANAHRLLAYMGNAKAGPVKVLPDSRTQVDGKKVALAKTPLGRCLNAAGAHVNTSAFRSNYVRLDVRID